ncbi:HAD-IA family hydrolase [Curvivirga aplysinae]|uniref:HAD-IA family hydrolase n=1 Tax=Curvivirga aplysinae TaxID=2529852 RepID=UPI0012BB8356|nr:HAD-IA family hydrolase [Curvivirga aplysinae]MTI11273.1 HAD family hydrolase [Curvivirga aplysinae]
MDRPKLVIFDCDGTLTDSQSRIVTATCYAFLQEGFEEPSRKDICHQVGLPLMQMMYNLCQKDDMDLLHRMVENYKKAVYEVKLPGTQMSPLFPDCRKTLTKLYDKGYFLGIATGMGRRGLERTVKDHGIDHLFTTLKSADDGPGKPNPDILLDSMLECGVEASDTVMIGDTVYDIEAGVNARAISIGVDWGYHAPEMLLQAGSYKVISSFNDLPELLDEVFIR